MADGEVRETEAASEESLQLSFPLPPAAYYKKYTDANVDNGVIPEPPNATQGAYSTFGDSFDVSIIRPTTSDLLPCNFLCHRKRASNAA